MKKVLKTAIIGLGIVIALGGSCTEVQAAKKAKARVTSVSTTVNSKKKTVKVSFKKDKKAKKYKIKKYRVKLTKYSYKKGKWVKGKSYYKNTSAYTGKKLKSKASVTFSGVTPSTTTAYKVQVSSANNNGVTKTSYTTSLEVGCFHEWFTTTTKKKVAEETYVYDDEMKCSACGFTGTNAEVDAHMDAYRAKEAESLPLIAKAYAEKYNCTEEDFYNEYNTTCDNESQVVKFVLDWMNDNTEFKGCNRDYSIGGCIYSTNTGNKIKVKVKDATYKNMMVTTCSKCGVDRNK